MIQKVLGLRVERVDLQRRYAVHAAGRDVVLPIASRAVDAKAGAPDFRAGFEVV